MKKIRLSVIAMLIGTLLMCPVYAAAETPEGITEIEYPPVYLDEVDEDMARAVGTIVSSFTQDSSTSASGYVNASTYGVASYIKVTVTLQQAPNGTTNYTNSTQSAVSKTVYNTNYITKSFSFKVSNSKEYRVKIVIKDKINSVISTKTYYKKMT